MNKNRQFIIGALLLLIPIMVIAVLVYAMRSAIHSTSSSRTIYVSVSAPSGGTGGQDQPFTSIQQAADIVQPGDTVIVQDGVYNENVTITRSGTSDGWITFQAANAHNSKVVGSGNGNAFAIRGANYIKISGFEVSTEGTGDGIYADFGHHTIIINNVVHDAGGSGIQLNHGDYRTVDGNIVYRNAFTAPWQTSGISLWQCHASDNAPGYHNIIRNNIAYENENKVVDENGQFTDGNGIIIDDSRNTQANSHLGPYQAETLIENNLVHNNGGRGIYTLSSDHVMIRNNTSYWNNRNISSGELTDQSSSDTTWVNNIAWANPSFGTGAVAILVDNAYGPNENSIWSNNITFNGTNGNPSIQITGGVSANISSANNNMLGKAPMLMNPNGGDFHLAANSPAIGAGTTDYGIPTTDLDQTPRPAGSGVDIGAYMYKGVSVLQQCVCNQNNF